MKAGDILLFHHGTSLADFKADPMGTLFVALIHFSTHSKWNHAALATSLTEYIEATAQGVRRSKIGSSSDQVQVVPVMFDDEEDRLTAVAWAAAREGERYGYLNAVMCGLNNIIVGLGFVIKRTDAIICSELVAEALERAGYDFGTDSALVAPGDLASAFGVGR